ncbi:tRNA (5-methylaminomethyl-2-thiouridine)(34)-methyltransferase MnmD [Spirosoma utsteinense]|uniref:tRNA U34 5-methylaminomethyl-2-thiouridine-forming methyltransferase MnmC n=1 Tax=Spirosoma utsteinense TaxID=2585773 RepID=A0ABR6W2G5_9BACT|nr:tRNA (5-methylaminomethyl-2-thiouridine)(34)-methyltransferase MnmD [Spirosoma utsteinense]MBC3790791.1 tRNA U34 5-methylaminomethyl-2-thiouridine-forming methyltransferase MnmC [Spirosoma utsteinense]
MNSTVRVIPTADGSHTVFNEILGKPYHSVHGAIQESQRVYIEVGLQAALEKFPHEELQIFEMGFGTGLNALLTVREAELHQRRVNYVAIDTYPLPLAESRQLNYDALLHTSYLPALHESPWHEPLVISPYFTLTKLEGILQDLKTEKRFHLIYYDAFAPSAQPELWEPNIFQQLATLLLPGGMMTTYCSKSYVQRNMRAAGLTVEKHPGPYGKRDILRAVNG